MHSAGVKPPNSADRAELRNGLRAEEFLEYGGIWYNRRAMDEHMLDDALARSQDLIAQRDWTAALDALDEATRLDPGCSIAWYHRGKILNRLERFEDALEAFEQMALIDPEDSDAWHHKGVILMKLGKTQLALEAFQVARRLGPPSNGEAEMGSIDFLGILGKDPSALESLERPTESSAPHTEADVYMNRRHAYSLQLAFEWRDGVREVLEIEEISHSRLMVQSSMHPRCAMMVEVRERVPCQYPARELVKDLAFGLTSEARDRDFYVFPNGLLPAYTVRLPGDEGDQVLIDIIATDRHVYQLTVVVSEASEVERYFARQMPLNFVPSAQV